MGPLRERKFFKCTNEHLNGLGVVRYIENNLYRSGNTLESTGKTDIAQSPSNLVVGYRQPILEQFDHPKHSGRVTQLIISKEGRFR